tara:strand:- start:192 stop:407 length:216 start_codon:yes stop_codon:yes gene_type:complete
MANMSYCRYENTANELQDVVNAIHESDCNEDLTRYEQDGLEIILDLAYEIIGLKDKIENIIENSNKYQDIN